MDGSFGSFDDDKKSGVEHSKAAKSAAPRARTISLTLQACSTLLYLVTKHTINTVCNNSENTNGRCNNSCIAGYEWYVPPRCLVASLPRCSVASLLRCLAASMLLCLRCYVASLFGCRAASLSSCFVASPYCCLTVSLPRHRLERL